MYTQQEIDYIKNLMLQNQNLINELTVLKQQINTLTNEKQYLLNYVKQLKDIIEDINIQKTEIEEKITMHEDFFN